MLFIILNNIINSGQGSSRLYYFFFKFRYMLYYCRPTMNLYKKTFLKYWEKTVNNRRINAIISIISGDSGFKI